MKKFAKLFALVLTMVLLVAAFVSCEKDAKPIPSSDAARAATALDEAGYDVEYTVGTSAVGVSFKHMTASVTASRIGYEEVDDDEIEYDIAYIFYFETANDAEYAFKALKELAREYFDNDFDIEVGYKDKVAWMGTEDALFTAR